MLALMLLAHSFLIIFFLSFFSLWFKTEKLLLVYQVHWLLFHLHSIIILNPSSDFFSMIIIFFSFKFLFGSSLFLKVFADTFSLTLITEVFAMAYSCVFIINDLKFYLYYNPLPWFEVFMVLCILSNSGLYPWHSE